jgi:hypothetical protein
MHQGWPKFAAHLWMSDGEGGLAAVSYAPCRVKAKVGAASGTEATIEVGGGYPFREAVCMKLGLKCPDRFAVRLRIPAWCASPELTVNGETVELVVAKGFGVIEREWTDGDTIELRLPMDVRPIHRNLQAVSVERGPLVYVLPIGENWMLHMKRELFSDWELYPSTPWRYGLIDGAGFAVETGDIVEQPFLAAQSPVRLRTRGSLVRNWRMEGNNADVPPLNPDTEGQSEEELVLVPYGSAKLRIGEFPHIGKR